jgi:hypothetical protein
MLGLDTDDITNAEIDLKLNMSWWELSAKLGFREKEATSSFSTVAGQREYATDTSIDTFFEALQSVTVKDIHSDRYEPLVMKGYEQIEGSLSDELEDRDMPKWYARYNDKLVLYPTPDRDYTIRVRYLKTLSDVQAEGFPVPQEWSEPILLGAVYRQWRSLGDWNNATAARMDRDGMVATLALEAVKENVSKVGGVSILRQRYP